MLQYRGTQLRFQTLGKKLRQESHPTLGISDHPEQYSKIPFQNKRHG